MVGRCAGAIRVYLGDLVARELLLKESPGVCPRAGYSRRVVTQSCSRRTFAALGPALACFVVLCPQGAAAEEPGGSEQGGSVRLVRRSIRESKGVWRALMLLRVLGQPVEPEMPLRFRFMLATKFVVSGDPSKPHHVPVDPPRVFEQKKSVDMRGIDGSVGRTARTEVFLSRQDGFFAGIYTLSVLGPNGPLGDPLSITLEGVNAPDDSTNP